MILMFVTGIDYRVSSVTDIAVRFRGLQFGFFVHTRTCILISHHKNYMYIVHGFELNAYDFMPLV